MVLDLLYLFEERARICEVVGTAISGRYTALSYLRALDTDYGPHTKAKVLLLRSRLLRILALPKSLLVEVLNVRF